MRRHKAADVRPAAVAVGVGRGGNGRPIGRAYAGSPSVARRAAREFDADKMGHKQSGRLCWAGAARIGRGPGGCIARAEGGCNQKSVFLSIRRLAAAPAPSNNGPSVLLIFLLVSQAGPARRAGRRAAKLAGADRVLGRLCAPTILVAQRKCVCVCRETKANTRHCGRNKTTNHRRKSVARLLLPSRSPSASWPPQECARRPESLAGLHHSNLLRPLQRRRPGLKRRRRRGATSAIR